MVPESACIPVPSEVTLIAAGFAAREGWLSPWLAVLAATAGNVVGSLLAYGIGRTRLLNRLPYLRALLARWEGMVERSGLRAVFVARLMPLARTFISLPAGALALPLGRFLLLTAAGCAIWAAGLLAVGVVAGSAWQAVSSYLGKALLLGAAVVIVAAVVRGRHRRRAEADRQRSC